MVPGIVMCAVAVVMWALAIFQILKARRATGRSVRVKGTVAGFEDYISHGRTMYVPIYRHVLPDGRAVQATGTLAKSWKSPAENTPVTLLYDAENAEQPLVKLGLGRFMPAIVFAGVGTLFTAISLAFLLSTPTPRPDTSEHRLQQDERKLDRERERVERKEQKAREREERQRDRDRKQGSDAPP